MEGIIKSLPSFISKELYLFIFIILAFGIVYLISKSVINSSRLSNDLKRRVISNMRMAYLLMAFISFVAIWATELYSAALSIAAFGAAFAIALKDVLMCIWGSFYRTVAHPFSIGDRIEIEGIRGDVVDIGMMSTQILEVGPKNMTHQYTGRTISIPNSKLILENIYNETKTAHEDDEYALHVFTIPIDNTPDWDRKRSLLLKAARKSCDKYVSDANKFFTRLAQIKKVDVPWVEPRVSTKVISPCQLEFIVRVSIPVRSKGIIEQEIVIEYLNQVHTS